MSSGQGAHSLAFRVMRLCRPTFQVDPPDYTLPIFSSEKTFSTTQLPCLNFIHSSTAASQLRLIPISATAPDSSSMNLPTQWVFPAFSSSLKPSEIQTERQRILLLDTSKSPVESIRAGGRYDFNVEHDVKELGAHTKLHFWKPA